MGDKIPEDVLADEVDRLRGLLWKWNEHLPSCAKWTHVIEWVGSLTTCNGEDVLDDEKECTCGLADVERELKASDG